MLREKCYPWIPEQGVRWKIRLRTDKKPKKKHPASLLYSDKKLTIDISIRNRRCACGKRNLPPEVLGAEGQMFHFALLPPITTVQMSKSFKNKTLIKTIYIFRIVFSVSFNYEAFYWSFDYSVRAEYNYCYTAPRGFRFWRIYNFAQNGFFFFTQLRRFRSPCSVQKATKSTGRTVRIHNSSCTH